MGCDIHMFAEVKKKYKREGVKPEWKTVGREFKNVYHRKGETTTYSTYGEGESFDSYEDNEILVDEPYNGRNYSLFAILANVRNGYGFAGVDTGDGYVPISEPKGVPADASDYYKHEVEKWAGDGHSHSYFTLQELLNYNWTQKTVRRGVVDVEQYAVYKKKGKPESWSGGVGGGMVQMISNKEMDKVLEDKAYVKRYKTSTLKGDDPHYYTQVSWGETYAESCESFVKETIPKLQQISGRKDVLDLRIVFFFDN